MKYLSGYYRKTRIQEILQFILLSFPAIAIYTIIIVALIRTVILSFYKWDGVLPREFVGISNYIRLLGEERFIFAIRNIVILIAATIVFQVIPGLVLAYLFSKTIKFEGFFKGVVFAPVIISDVAVIAFFIQFFAYYGGYLNSILGIFGIEPINWFSFGKYEIFVAIVPQTWQYIGLMFVIGLAGFASISQDHIDASKLDGLNEFQRLIYIFIPLSWDTISVCFILAMVGPLKSFVHIWLFNEGGTDQLSHIPGTLMYLVGFNTFNFGYGSSIAVLIFIIAGGITLLFRNVFVQRNY